jgi:hypothetical protein
MNGMSKAHRKSRLTPKSNCNRGCQKSLACEPIIYNQEVIRVFINQY